MLFPNDFGKQPGPIFFSRNFFLFSHNRVFKHEPPVEDHATLSVADLSLDIDKDTGNP